MQCKVMIARFPGNFHEDPDNVTWLMLTYAEMLKDPRIEKVHMYVKADTPITMTRNEAVHEAQQEKCDYLLMVDNDMKPDYQRANKVLKPFWKSSFDWIFRREAPSVICAPYVGPNPYNNIYVFRWETPNNYDPLHFKLGQFSRNECAERSGIEQVAAIPTGLCLIDMRIFSRGGPNWFEYEWNGDGDRCPQCQQFKPGPRIKKDSTEDVMWSRDVSSNWRDVPGSGVFCNWDSWAIHIKRGYCLPPELPHVNHLGTLFDQAIALGSPRSDESMKVVGDGTPIVLPRRLGTPVFRQGVMDPMATFVDLTEGGAGYGPEFNVPDRPLVRGSANDDGRLLAVDAEVLKEQIRDAYPELAPKGGADDGRI